MNSEKIEPALPKFGRGLLICLVHTDIRDQTVADFEERFSDLTSQKGRFLAETWFWIQIIRSFPSFLIDRLWWAAIMGRSHFVITWRNIKKNKFFAAINIIGLSIGLSCSILVLLFIFNELSYDRYHENANRIYRIVQRRAPESGEGYSAQTPWMMKAFLQENFPEVQSAARLWFQSDVAIGYGEKKFSSYILYSDPSILDVFGFPLIRGDKKKALIDPHGALISEKTAQKFFGNEDPIGKNIVAHYREEEYALQIEGVLRNLPKNSHFQIDILAPIESVARRFAKRLKLEEYDPCMTYVLLRPNSNYTALDEKIAKFASSLKRRDMSSAFFLQPLVSIYLHSENIPSSAKTSRLSISYSLSGIVLIILMIVGINFVVLSTSRAIGRYKEIGQRRVIGATRAQLFAQVLSECVFMVLFSLAVAFGLAWLTLPIFNSLMNSDLSFSSTLKPSFILSMLAFTVLDGILAGTYPALFLSSRTPVDAIKGRILSGKRPRDQMKKGLLGLQYAISLIFIMVTAIMARQIRYIKNKPLGFQKDNIIRVLIWHDPVLLKSPEKIQSLLMSNPDVEDAIVAGDLPGVGAGERVPTQPEGYQDQKTVNLWFVPVWERYFEFFKIDILRGRDITHPNSDAGASSILINESAARFLGWDDPIGKQIRSEWVESNYDVKGPYTIVGVVRDFHIGPLQETIPPCFYLYKQGSLRYAVWMRIHPINIKQTMAFVESTFQKLGAVQPFSYSFLDDLLATSYEKERASEKLFSVSSLLSFVLSVLGIIGLVSYSVERRKKELGIRKILGASGINIMKLLSDEFGKLILMGTLISVPIAFWFGHRFLNGFAYKVGIGWWVFILPPLSLLVTTLVIIAFRSAKAAFSVPLDSIRQE